MQIFSCSGLQTCSIVVDRPASLLVSVPVADPPAFGFANPTAKGTVKLHKSATRVIALVPSEIGGGIVFRCGLAQRGFALKSETLCRAAGRLYTVINAQYTGRAAEPTGLACLCGKTQGQPEAQAYREQQLVKLKKYRLGLAPGPQADGVDALIQEMEDGLWP